MAKAEIGFSMGLDAVSFTKGMQAASRMVEAQAKAMQKAIIATGAVLAVAFGVNKFGDMILGSIEAGKALDSLSRESGIAVDQIELMRHAFDRSGQSAESTVGILTDLRNTMREASNASEGVGLTIYGLGMNLAELQKKNVADQFKEIALRVNAIKDPVERAAAATALLGANGAKAAANFNAGDMGRASKLFGIAAEAMGKGAPGLARASDAFKRIQEGGKMFFDIIVARLAPVFEKVAIMIEDLLPKVAGIADQIGKGLMFAINFTLQAFKEGKIGTIVWLSLKVAFMKAVDFLYRAMTGIGKVLWEVVSNAFSVLGNGDLWSSIGGSLSGAFKIALGAWEGGWLQAIKSGTEFFMAGLTWVIKSAAKLFQVDWIAGLKKVVSFFTSGIMWAAEQAAKIMNPSAKGGKSMIDVMKSAGESVAGLAEKFGEALGEASVDPFKAFTDLLDKGIKSSMDLMIKGSNQLSASGTKFLESLRKGETSMEAMKAKFMEGMAGKGIFGEDADAAWKKLKDEVNGLMKRMKPLTAEGGGVEPGKGETLAGKKLFRETAFDTFRKVGGGLGAAGRSIAQKSLDKLTEIAKGVSTMASSGGARFRDSTGARLSSPVLTTIS